MIQIDKSFERDTKNDETEQVIVTPIFFIEARTRRFKFKGHTSEHAKIYSNQCEKYK